MAAFPYHMRHGRDLTERHPNADMATVSAFFNLPRRLVFPTYGEAPHYVERGRLLDERAMARARRLARRYAICIEQRGDRFYIAPELLGRKDDPLRGARVRQHGREVLEAVELVVAFYIAHPTT